MCATHEKELTNNVLEFTVTFSVFVNLCTLAGGVLCVRDQLVCPCCALCRGPADASMLIIIMIIMFMFSSLKFDFVYTYDIILCTN